MLKIHDMPSSADNKDRIKEIQAELRQLELQRQSLLLELGHISEPDIEETTGFLGEQAFYEVTETPEEKIQLFLRLFRCRRDVFPRYWENERSGKAGYSPVCANEWEKGICIKPKVKCRSCSNQAFVPFDSDSVRDHLTGRTAIGSYAIDGDDKCVFLAADFDKSTWKEDITSYRESAAEMCPVRDP